MHARKPQLFPHARLHAHSNSVLTPTLSLLAVKLGIKTVYFGNQVFMNIIKKCTYVVFGTLSKGGHYFSTIFCPK